MNFYSIGVSSSPAGTLGGLEVKFYPELRNYKGFKLPEEYIFKLIQTLKTRGFGVLG
jgi:hypothetical protein